MAAWLATRSGSGPHREALRAPLLLLHSYLLVAPLACAGDHEVSS